MKLVKFLITALAVGLLMSVPALRAQDGGKKKGGGQSPAQQVAAIDEAVGGLNDDQKAKITKILEKVAADIAAVPQEERQAKAGELRAASRTEIAAVLTPEQKEKYMAMPQ